MSGGQSCGYDEEDDEEDYEELSKRRARPKATRPRKLSSPVSGLDDDDSESSRGRGRGRPKRRLNRVNKASSGSKSAAALQNPHPTN
jgi:hypothetical protein